MIFKPGPFKKPLNRDVQDFESRTEVESMLNCDDVIINLIII